MPTIISQVLRALAARVVSGSLVGAQRVTPSVQPLRVAGELGAGAVGFTLGAEGGLLVAAGVAYLVQGHGGDVTSPRLQRALTPILVAGGGVGAGTASWLVSRANGQSSDWGLNVAVSTVVTALAFRYAGWPMTGETAERRRSMGRWRLLAPVWMSAFAATAVATATRETR
ncbi:MAG: hypothetical protein ACYC7F_12865 [Gemmatimonadaceae bacterium]